MVVATAVLLGMAGAALAADLTWDNGQADGNWNTTATNWSGTTPWNNSTPDNAIFGDVGAGAVNVSENITAGTVTVSSGANYTFSGSDLTLNSGIASSGIGEFTFGNKITGAGSITHSGGILNIDNNNNDFSGGVALNGGTLSIGDSGALGSGTVTVNSGTIQMDNNNKTTANDMVLNGGTLAVENLTTWTLSGGVAINGTDVRLVPGVGDRFLQLAGSVGGDGDFLIGRGTTRILASCNWTQTGEITLSRTGPQNTVLEISDGRTLSNNIKVDNQSNSQIRYLGLVDSATTGTFAGDINVAAEGNDGRFGFRARADDTITVSGNIVGDNNDTGVNIDGGGKVVFTGANTYRDRTQINGGSTLELAETATMGSDGGTVINIAAGSSLINNSSTDLGITINNNGGTIGGSGTFNTTLTLDSLADVLAPGNSPGTMGFGSSQDWDSFTYDWETKQWVGAAAGTDYDTIDITGSLDLTAGTYAINLLSLDLSDQSGSIADFDGSTQTFVVISTSGGITGFDAADWSFDASGFANDTDAAQWSLALSADGNDLELSYAIPEPAALTLVALIGGGMLFVRRRFK